MTINSIGNKLRLLSETGVKIFCSQCQKDLDTKDIIAKEIAKCKKACARLQFSFIEYFRATDTELSKVKYRCKCNREKCTLASNLCIESKQDVCNRCMQDKNRHQYEKVKKYFASRQCELLSLEYKNRNKPLDFRCVCGTISKIRYKDFAKGARCKEKCKLDRYRGTCQKSIRSTILFKQNL